MSETEIRAQIVAVLNTVADIGRVHNRFRYSADMAKFLSLFKTTIGGKDQVRGWMVSQIAPLNEDYTETKTRNYAIDGYLGFQDEGSTELTMSALLDAIAAAFRNNKTLNGAALGHDYIQVQINEPRSFGAVLCHYAHLTLAVQDFIG